VGKTSWIAKTKMTPKFSTRRKSRCNLCGRSHAFMRKFGTCRICFRELASTGRLPGITKASF